MTVAQARFIQRDTIGVVERHSQRCSLVDIFKANYSLQLANTPELLREVYRLRYKVYCQDNAFEPADKFSDRLEKDGFDRHSEHFLVTEKTSGRCVGTVRLILSQTDFGIHETPLQLFCSGALFHHGQITSLAPGQYAEISRLAVCSGSRLSLMETLSGKLSQQQVARLSYSVVSVALAYCCVARFQGSASLTHGFTMMEPRLAVLLSRMGIRFDRVGRPMEYHGIRAPYLWQRAADNLSFSEDQLRLYEMIESSINEL